jgi:hypothetical protein
MTSVCKEDRNTQLNLARDTLTGALRCKPTTLFVIVGAGVSIVTTQGTRHAAVGPNPLTR